MTTIEQLTERITSFRDARDWKQFHTLKDMALSLMLESGEAGELFQWKSDAEIESKLPELRPELGRELSDVLYWVLLMAHDAGIDLPNAFEQKMRENEAKYPVDAARGSSRKYSEL